MRAGLSTIHQTLTAEAATVLNQSITEAGRRNHGQTTPLHVASTLLASPTGFLRQACIRSHPNSSHPLQCRALELCFSVALERLPTAQSSTEPPISNALMAALKRAQAHQRRGCPEQQQQPLLAVKVELEQLIISILDDPSVSRVMREASFSSPAVKATIEQSLNPNQSKLTNPVLIPMNRNLYLNPRLQKNQIAMNPRLEKKNDEPLSRNLYMNPNLGSGNQKSDDMKRVIEIMNNPKKKNPILVGESEPEAIRNEILRRIEKGEFGEWKKNVEVISIEKEFGSLSDKPKKIKELDEKIQSSNSNVIIDLCDLKWLVEQPPISSVGRESVAEMAKLVSKFSGKVWLIGIATCETYLRCQVYHPSMETDWDLQAVAITSKSPLFPRVGIIESLNSVNNFSNKMISLQKQNLDPSKKASFCLKCSIDYEQELAKLKEVKSNLPQWLQMAKTKDQLQVKDQEEVLEHKIQELQKKWSDSCLRLHPYHNQSTNGLCKSNLLVRQTPRLQPPTTTQQPRLEPPRSPVRTDLVLGRKKSAENEDLTVKDLLGCISSESQAKAQEFHKGKFANSADTDSYKKLVKGLMKKAWWQPEAASAIATTITQSKVNRGSVWLLFAGPDRVAKKKMAWVVAEHVCGANPITIGLGSNRDDDETDTGFRGKTILDRIVEAVRRNPSSVIVLSDIDEADTLVRASIKRAMERGRLTDSHGREISLGNVVFVLTGNWSTANVDEYHVDEQRLHSIASRDWQLMLTVGGKRLKRRADWLSKDQSKKPSLDLSLDLNLAMDYEDDGGSINSSNLTQEDDGLITAVPHELVGPSDGAVVFRPPNFGYIRREIEKTVKNAFLSIFDEKMRIEVDEDAVENLLGGLWFGRTSLEEWAEEILVPTFRQLSSRMPDAGQDVVVRLESDRDSGHVGGGGGGDWLPRKIAMVVDGV